MKGSRKKFHRRNPATSIFPCAPAKCLPGRQESSQVSREAREAWCRGSVNIVPKEEKALKHTLHSDWEEERVLEASQKTTRNPFA